MTHEPRNRKRSGNSRLCSRSRVALAVRFLFAKLAATKVCRSPKARPAVATLHIVQSPPCNALEVLFATGPACADRTPAFIAEKNSTSRRFHRFGRALRTMLSPFAHALTGVSRMLAMLRWDLRVFVKRVEHVENSSIIVFCVPAVRPCVAIPCRFQWCPSRLCPGWRGTSRSPRQWFRGASFVDALRRVSGASTRRQTSSRRAAHGPAPRNCARCATHWCAWTST